jgi:hypothetical protein
MTAANWSSGIRIVDEGEDGIKGLATLNRELLVGCIGGLYSVNADDIVKNITQGAGLLKDDNNGLGIVSWAGFVWYPTASGLFAYRDGTLWTDVGPDTLSQSVWHAAQSPILAMTGSAKWLYAATYDGTNTWFWRGRMRTSGDPLGSLMVWHYMRTETGKTTAMLVSGIPAPTAGAYLWGAQDGAAKAYNIPTTQPLNTSLERAPSGDCYMPIDDFGFPQSQKALHSVVVIGENITANEDVVIKGTNEAGSSLTNLEVNASNSATAWSSLETGRWWKMRFTVRRDAGTDTNTPKIYKIGIRFFVRPDQDRVYTCILDCVTGAHTADGKPIREDGETQLTNLIALAENTATVALSDEWGTSYTGVVNSAVPMARIAPSADEGPGWRVQLTFAIT